MPPSHPRLQLSYFEKKNFVFYKFQSCVRRKLCLSMNVSFLKAKWAPQVSSNRKSKESQVLYEGRCHGRQPFGAFLLLSNECETLLLDVCGLTLQT